nr:hypothetical protein HmN_000499300 [Hymenolepis microstoma]
MVINLADIYLRRTHLLFTIVARDMANLEFGQEYVYDGQVLYRSSRCNNAAVDGEEPRVPKFSDAVHPSAVIFQSLPSETVNPDVPKPCISRPKQPRNVLERKYCGEHNANMAEPKNHLRARTFWKVRCDADDTRGHMRTRIQRPLSQ